MASKINIAATVAMVSAFVWSLSNLATTALPERLFALPGVDGATHLQAAQSLVLGISYNDSLFLLFIVATVIGSQLAQTAFGRTEM